ncbi:MAG TPA: hypothetical protein VKK79_25965 [Candidatus Lokiarchaeia archaeon]|nr:hypothetical protein [Candidatus Lokiarchaeia archaeon]
MGEIDANSEMLVRSKKCVNCGAVNHPSKVRCRACKGTTFEDVSVPPAGTVVTFTTCNALPRRLGDRKSQGFAIIQVAEGWNVLGQLDDADAIALNDLVEGRWEQVSTNDDGSPAFGWVFRKGGA